MLDITLLVEHTIEVHFEQAIVHQVYAGLPECGLLSGSAGKMISKRPHASEHTEHCCSLFYVKRAPPDLNLLQCKRKIPQPPKPRLAGRNNKKSIIVTFPE